VEHLSDEKLLENLALKAMRLGYENSGLVAILYESGAREEFDALMKEAKRRLALIPKPCACSHRHEVTHRGQCGDCQCNNYMPQQQARG